MDAFISFPLVLSTPPLFPRTESTPTRRHTRWSLSPISMKKSRHRAMPNEDDGHQEQNNKKSNGDDFSNALPRSARFSSPHSRRNKGTEASSRRGLEMSWRFQTRKGDNPSVCEKCKGYGKVECSWCHATGVLMLGDRLLCSIEGQSHCLACDNGQIPCKACKGTGKLASWMVHDL